MLPGAGDEALTRFRREHVGFIFQFYNLSPSLTAREYVALVTEIAPHPLDPADTLALVGLRDRMDHFPAQLSDGEQQRVAISRAIAKRPDVLLCNEPTGALDSMTGILVLLALEHINRETGALGVEEQHVWVKVELASSRAPWRTLGETCRVTARFVLREAAGGLRVRVRHSANASHDEP